MEYHLFLRDMMYQHLKAISEEKNINVIQNRVCSLILNIYHLLKW